MSKKKTGIEENDKETQNEKYNKLSYIVKNDVKRKTKGFLDNNPSSTKLEDISNEIQKVIGNDLIDHKYSRTKQLECQTISVSLTNKNELIISGNVKEIREPNKFDQTLTVKEKGTGKYTYTSNRHGIDKELANHILNVTKQHDVYKNSDLNVAVIEKGQKSEFTNLSILDKAKDNAKSHAEMKTLKYCDDTKQKVEKMGISKPACKNCHSELVKNGIEFTPNVEGKKRVTNWEKKEEIQNVNAVRRINREKAVECKFSMGSNNFKPSADAMKKNLKNNIKNSAKPAGHVGLISGFIEVKNTLENENFESHCNVNALTSNSGVCENKLGIGQAAYANVSAFVCNAGMGNVVGVGASALSASVYAEYGLENSIGADLTVVRAQGNIGPVQVGTGLSFDTNASIGVNGVGASFFGTGFHIGPKSSLKTPFFDISCSLF